MTAQTLVDVVGSLLTSWKLIPRDVATSLNVIEFNRLHYSPKVALQPVVFLILNRNSTTGDNRSLADSAWKSVTAVRTGQKRRTRTENPILPRMTKTTKRTVLWVDD